MLKKYSATDSHPVIKLLIEKGYTEPKLRYNNVWWTVTTNEKGDDAAYFTVNQMITRITKYYPTMAKKEAPAPAPEPVTEPEIYEAPVYTGRDLFNFRIERGWTQKQTALRMGYNKHNTIGRKEEGLNEMSAQDCIILSYLMQEPFETPEHNPYLESNAANKKKLDPPAKKARAKAKA